MRNPITPITEQSCGNCLFNRGNECHRYPPKHIATESKTDYYLDDGHKVYETEHEPTWQFPEVDSHDWCGEWAGESKKE